MHGRAAQARAREVIDHARELQRVGGQGEIGVGHGILKGGHDVEDVSAHERLAAGEVHLDDATRAKQLR